MSCVFTYAVLHSSRATPSRTKLYAMAFDLFFSVDAGAVVLFKTDWLSPKTNAGSSTVRSPRTYSVACFIATNSLPKVLVSHEFCFFELQYIGELFRKTINPVLERRVMRSPNSTTHPHEGKQTDRWRLHIPEVEILNLSMLKFVDSPGNHRSLLLDVSTRSLLGEHLNKICRPVSRRLVTSQKKSTTRYNKIFKEQCSIHRIQERMDAIVKMTKYCGYPSPKWLEKKMLTLYVQLTEIRRYAEKKCRKILTPDSDFSPTIQMWYDRIHVYQQLIKLKLGKSSKARNLFRFARNNNIPSPENLSLEELEDGLQLARLRKAGLKKSAGELRKNHLRECLLKAQSKKDLKKAKAIKERMQRENSKRYGT